MPMWGERVDLKLAKQVGRVESMVVPLDPDQEKRFETLMDSLVLIDIHQHPMVLTEEISDLIEYFGAMEWTWGYEAVRAGGWTAVGTANGLAPLGRARELATVEFPDLANEVALMLTDMSSQQGVVKVETADDILAAKQSGQIGFFPTVEHLALGLELHHVDVLYGIGVRLAGLTYARDCTVGGGQYESSNNGLSELGGQVVDRMNDLGMIIDVSHASQRTALEVIDRSEAPVIFSHNASKSLWDNRRTRPDSDFEACAAKGGAVFVTAVPNSMSDDPNQDINCVLDQYDHLIALLGPDHVGIGTDTLIGDHVRVTDEVFHRGTRGPVAPAPYINGLESPADGKNIIRGLISRGHSDEVIRKVAGDNALRIIREVVG
jgi:membrane dipeptidase